jgi:polyisoprenoid-binding protein YceI
VRKRLGIAAAALVAAVVLAGAALWWFVLRDDAPPRAALPDREIVDADGRPLAGTWVVEAGDDVFVGYRIEERFGLDTLDREAAGRTPAVEGAFVIDGGQITEGSVTADVTQLESGQLRRDRYIERNALETRDFPEATFVLTEPSALGDTVQPGATEELVLVGHLTLHGVTNEVVVPVEARWNGDTIDVAGSTPIVLADYGIEPPDIAGTVRVAPEGELELQLTFVRR